MKIYINKNKNPVKNIMKFLIMKEQFKKMIIIFKRKRCRYRKINKRLYEKYGWDETIEQLVKK